MLPIASLGYLLQAVQRQQGSGIGGSHTDSLQGKPSDTFSIFSKLVWAHLGWFGLIPHIGCQLGKPTDHMHQPTKLGLLHVMSTGPTVPNLDLLQLEARNTSPAFAMELCPNLLKTNQPSQFQPSESSERPFVWSKGPQVKDHAILQRLKPPYLRAIYFDM